MTTDIEAIAAGLSEAQRRALVNAEFHGSGQTQFALVDCIEAKLTGVLADMFTLRWDKLTPLGLSVRAHLLSQQEQTR